MGACSSRWLPSTLHQSYFEISVTGRPLPLFPERSSFSENPSLPSSSYSSPFSWPRVTPQPHFCLDSRRWHLPPVCLSFPPRYSPLSPSLWVVFPTLHLTFSCLQQTFIALYPVLTVCQCTTYELEKKKILTCQVALTVPKFPSCTHVDTILLDLRIIPQNINACCVELVVWGKRAGFKIQMSTIQTFSKNSPERPRIE